MKKQIRIWLWLLCLVVLLTACASGVTRVQDVPLSRQVPDEPAATAAPVTEAPTEAGTSAGVTGGDTSGNTTGGSISELAFPVPP